VISMDRIIKTAAEYEAAVAEIERLMALPDAEEEGETADRIEFFALLAEDYETRHYGDHFPPTAKPAGEEDPGEEEKLKRRLQAELKRLGGIYSERSGRDTDEVISWMDLGTDLLPFVLREIAKGKQ
jgi:hypothetical protein